MATVKEKMTALADEVREISGSEELMGLDDMQQNLDVANENVQTESDLIEQIQVALENKISVDLSDYATIEYVDEAIAAADVGEDIYVQAEEPTNAEDGAVWIDLDDNEGGAIDNGESNVLIVSIDEGLSTDTNMVATHSPAEILEAANAGKFIMFQAEGVRFDFVSCSDTRATFSTTTVEFNQSEHSTYSINVSIIADKTMEMSFEGGLILPSTGKVGQIAKFIGNGKTEWADPDLFIVTLTATSDTAGTSSHTPSEIKAAVDSGKMVTCVLEGTGMTFDLTFVGESTAMFNRVSVSSVDGTDDRCETVMTMVVINSNKEVSLDMQSAMGVPAGGTTNQILSNDENGKPIWVNTSSIMEGLAAEPELFIVTVSMGNGLTGTASHSSVEINDAYVNGKLPVVIDSTGGMILPSTCTAEKAEFYIIVPLSVNGAVGGIISVTYAIDSNKNITADMKVANCVPSGGTVGQVLSKNANDGLEWVDPPSGDSNNILVTLSGSTMTSNLSASEIIAYIKSNKIVHAIVTDSDVMPGFVFTPFMIDENDPAVIFHAEFVEDGNGASSLIVIYEDKTFVIGVEEVIGVPTGGTQGKVLTSDVNGRPVWSDVSSGLPSGGTPGQVLTMGSDGNPVWANPEVLPSAEGELF